MVKDKVVRPSGELGMSKSVVCDTFLLLLSCCLGNRTDVACRRAGCWFVGGDELTGVLHIL